MPRWSVSRRWRQRRRTQLQLRVRVHVRVRVRVLVRVRVHVRLRGPHVLPEAVIRTRTEMLKKPLTRILGRCMLTMFQSSQCSVLLRVVTVEPTIP